MRACAHTLGRVIGWTAKKVKVQNLPDTMTHKKEDKTADKERMKGDKADTVTNKKGDKRKQKGDQADTVTNKKGDAVTNKKGAQGRQAGRKADTLWAARRKAVWGSTEITWETNE